jgi:hypothetical protein
MAIQRDQRRCYHLDVLSPAELPRPWARFCRWTARTAVVITLVAGLAPAALRAQTAEEDEPAAATGEDKAKARVYFERAETLKHSGSARAEAGDMAGARAAYTQAASMYLRAFALFPHAAFLYNAAQMQRLSGHSAKAIATYERYLEVDPEGDKAEEASGYIAELRRNRASGAATSKRDASKAGEASGEDGEDGEEDAADGDADADGDDGADASADGDGDADADASADGDEALPGTAGATSGLGEGKGVDRGRSLRMGGLITLAAGALSLGVGVKFGLDAQDIAEELSGPRDMWTQEDRERFADGESAERTAVILMGVGGAAVLTGTVLYLVGLGRDGSLAGERGLGVSASATSDSASMLLWGRF